MLSIPKHIVEAIFAQAEKEAPIEACGYLAGNDNQISKYYPMTNTDQSRDHFTLDPKEQFKIIKEARKDNLKILSLCHSHPETPSRPSTEDIKLAFDPAITYIICSLLDQKIKAFKIKNGVVSPEELIIKEDKERS